MAALAVPLAACSAANGSAAPASVSSSTASVSIPSPESQTQQIVQMFCSQMDDVAASVRTATSANISDVLGDMQGTVREFQGTLPSGTLYTKLYTDFNTLADDLNSASTPNPNGPGTVLTGLIAPIQTTLNRVLADCQGGGP